MSGKFLGLGAALALLVSGSASATILNVYTTQAAYLADLTVNVQNADTATFGPSGPGPLINQTGVASSLSGGLTTIAAVADQLFGNGTVLSTNISGDTIVLTFSQPLRALGFFGFVTDETFAAIAGSLKVDVAGSGIATLTNTAQGPEFIGFTSDVSFSSVQVSILTFDSNATSAPFVTLTESILPSRAPVSNVPAPGAAAVLVAMAATAWAAAAPGEKGGLTALLWGLQT